MTYGTVADCCYYGCYGSCNSAAQPQQMASILGSYGVSGWWKYGTLSESSLIAELSQERPLILGYSDLSGGHVVTLFGFDSTTGAFLVTDPAYLFNGGAPIFYVTYQQLQYYAGKEWSITFYGMTTDGSCASGFDYGAGSGLTYSSLWVLMIIAAFQL
eukprot:CAMPEP_0168548210 /NCGR_PEP_ID=MMETSP0413-20121227/4440_1 /TAXON_ID=136452 /ORGANISM="Filamoeba nolandi, Strain NC-AS-23-1" /LENGTH=157 /DNA_ID=CAMNT_0008578499 /DNA_START=334 /DNA_END=807 /DNA_ORIENTATION=+